MKGVDPTEKVYPGDTLCECRDAHHKGVKQVYTQKGTE